MSSSGVLVNPECQATFQKMAENKKEVRYIIYKIDNNEVMVEKAAAYDEVNGGEEDYDSQSKAAYEQFMLDVKTSTNDLTDCRYAVFDFKFCISRQGAGQSKMGKLVFIQLCPDGASVKKKMLYASSASAIKSALGTGKILQFQASDESDMSHKELLGKLMEKYADN